MTRSTPGIRQRHARTCPSLDGGTCRCTPSFEAFVWSPRAGRKIRKTFATISAAKAWRSDSMGAVRRGQLQPASSLTLRQAADAWVAGAKDGSIRTRSGDAYKPSAIRGYEQALRDRILPELGGAKLAAIARVDLQDVADRWLASGLDPSTIRNSLMPLRAIYRRAIARGEVALNPTSGLELPAVRGRRDRIASPGEAGELLAALPERDRALWATALYAGLRRGELQALRWDDVDLAAGLIRVERSWDPAEGEIAPKSRAGTRTVPIAAVLRSQLLEHKLRSGRSNGLVFGDRVDRPFDPRALARRAATAWKHANAERTEGEQEPLEPINLHESRHTFASLAIAAGVNAKALSTYLGHASISITLDRYGHLMPGNEEEAAALLDRYLERAAGDASASVGV
jgi:integrase